MNLRAITQQLAQYSQVEQSIQQTGLLKDMLGRLGTNDMTQASGLIGRTAEFSNSVASLTPDGSARWRWTLPHAAAGMTAEIRDSSGKLVASPIIATGATSGSLNWDGLLADGSRAPVGAYSLKLTAKDVDGADLAATVHSIGRVEDVTQRDGELWLGLGGSVALPLTDLIGVAATV